MEGDTSTQEEVKTLKAAKRAHPVNYYRKGADFNAAFDEMRSITPPATTQHSQVQPLADELQYDMDIFPVLNHVTSFKLINFAQFC